MDKLNEMIECIKFNINGNTGFLKNPSHNLKDIHRTYSHIHYISIKGIIGAIQGFKGYIYNKQYEDEVLPQFYRELKDLKVAIVPSKYQFETKLITFNNATGFGNGRNTEGKIQNISEQWLIDPSWDIYVMSGHKHYNEIKKRLLEEDFVYDLYVGRRGHGAFIENIEVAKLEEVTESCFLDSLFIQEDFQINNIYETKNNESIKQFCYELPLKLDEELKNMYDVKTFNLSNLKVKILSDNKVYKCNEKNIVFY